MPAALRSASLRPPVAYLGQACLTGGLLALTLVAAQAQTFAGAVTYGAGNGGNPYSIAVADVNADGRRDIITGNASNISVLLNNGTGTFSNAASYPLSIGATTLGVAAADLDGDGKPDLVTANYATNSISVLRGNGNGTFQAATTYSLGGGGGLFGAAVADLNADGKPDVVAAYRSSLAILLNDGTGTLGVAVPQLVGPLPLDAIKVAIGDLNNDGKADLVAGYSYNGNLAATALLLGNGNGTFQAPRTVSLPNQPNSLTLADLNADNKLDVITSSDTGGNGYVMVQLGNGDGTLATATSYASSSNGQTRSVTVADVSGDSKPDLIIANPGNYTVEVLKNNGNGTFVAGTSVLLSSSPYGVVAADVSGDSKPDIVTVHIGAYLVSVLVNTSTFLATRPPALASEVVVYPNPVAATATTFTISGLPANSCSVTAILLDPLGRVVTQAAVPASQGAVQAMLPTAGLAAGLYQLRLQVSGTQGTILDTLPTQQVQVQ